MSYSYSRLATLDQCPYKHKLIYIDGHYIFSPAIATDFGTLIHSIEESIGKYIKNKSPIDYDLIKDNLNKGIEKIKNDYDLDFYTLDKSNRTYDGKYHFYFRNGLHRLEKRLINNKDLEIIGLEKEFYVDYKGLTFHGFIDRLFKYKNTYIIEDIKTYSQEVSEKDLESPLQFVIYALAVKDMYKTDNIRCSYDLPLCDKIQEVNHDFMIKGLKKLDKLIDKLNSNIIEPNPSPLCHWCVFSGTYPNQPDEAKGLCPYYSLWTRENKTKECNKPWLGEKIEITKNENINI